MRLAERFHGKGRSDVSKVWMGALAAIAVVLSGQTVAQESIPEAVDRLDGEVRSLRQVIEELRAGGAGSGSENIAWGEGFAVFKNRAGSDVLYIGEAENEYGLLKIYSNTGWTGAETTVFPEGGGTFYYDDSGDDKVFIGVCEDRQGCLSINGEQVKDFAEVFDLAHRDGVVPGTVMAIAGESGALAPSTRAYDPSVVGVVSGAGGYRPGFILGSRADGSKDLPIAMNGQIFVRVSAEAGPVAPGDLLVASNTPGVAMRAADPGQAFGAVIGKALGRFDGAAGGEGLVRMLVMVR